MKALVLMFLVALPAKAGADGYGFMTPSGNIYCNGMVTDSEIVCTIIARSGPMPKPRPASCSGTWGHEFRLASEGPPIMSCGRTPQAVDYSDIARYGLSADLGDITCLSEQAGLTCRNKTGHGFFLSRREQRLF